MSEYNVNPQETSMSSQTYSTTAAAKGSSYNDFFSVDSAATDSPSHVNETVWNPEWDKWHGFYKSIPEYAAAINKIAAWTFQRGIKMDSKNRAKFDKIKGNGKETPRGVLKKIWKNAMICGDGYAEIVKDNQKRITNLKPLNPATMVTVFNSSGIIIRYEQYTSAEGKKISTATWQPDEIYHLMYEPIGDEIHGKPFGEKLVELIEMRNEAMRDQKVVFHRYVKPLQIIKVKSDDDTDLNTVQTSFDNSYKKTENIIIPDRIVEKVETMSIPQFSTLDPLNWLKYIIRQFVTAAGVPEVVMGWGAETTEASSKVILMSFVVDIKDYQGYNEEQIESQLNIKLTLTPPPDLEPELNKDNKKDGDQRMSQGTGTADKDTR